MALEDLHVIDQTVARALVDLSFIETVMAGGPPSDRFDEALASAQTAGDEWATGYLLLSHAFIEALQQEKPDPALRISLTEFAARRLAPGIFLVTYRTTWDAGADEPGRSRLRSSIWKLIDGRWQMAFHQGTPSPLPD